MMQLPEDLIGLGCQFENSLPHIDDKQLNTNKIFKSTNIECVKIYSHIQQIGEIHQNAYKLPPTPPSTVSSFSHTSEDANHRCNPTYHPRPVLGNPPYSSIDESCSSSIKNEDIAITYDTSQLLHNIRGCFEDDSMRHRQPKGDIVSNAAAKHRVLSSITLTQQYRHGPITFSPPKGSDELDLALDQYMPYERNREMKITQIIQNFEHWRAFFAPHGPVIKRYNVVPELQLKVDFYCQPEFCSWNKVGFLNIGVFQQNQCRIHPKFAICDSATEPTTLSYETWRYLALETALSWPSFLRFNPNLVNKQVKRCEHCGQHYRNSSTKDSYSEYLPLESLENTDKIILSHFDKTRISPKNRHDVSMLLRALVILGIIKEIFAGYPHIESRLATFSARRRVQGYHKQDINLLECIKSATIPSRQHSEGQCSSKSTLGILASSNTVRSISNTNITTNDGDSGSNNDDESPNDPTEPTAFIPRDLYRKGYSPKRKLRCHFPGCKGSFKSYNSILDHQTRYHLLPGYRCPRCLNIFDSQIAVTNHLAGQEERCEKVTQKDNKIDQGVHDQIRQEIRKRVNAKWSYTKDPGDSEMTRWVKRNLPDFVGDESIPQEETAKMQRDLAKWYIIQSILYPHPDHEIPPHPFFEPMGPTSTELEMIINATKEVFDDKIAGGQHPFTNPTSTYYDDIWKWLADRIREAHVRLSFGQACSGLSTQPTASTNNRIIRVGGPRRRSRRPRKGGQHQFDVSPIPEGTTAPTSQVEPEIHIQSHTRENTTPFSAHRATEDSFFEQLYNSGIAEQPDTQHFKQGVGITQQSLVFSKEYQYTNHSGIEQARHRGATKHPLYQSDEESSHKRRRMNDPKSPNTGLELRTDAPDINTSLPTQMIHQDPSLNTIDQQFPDINSDSFFSIVDEENFQSVANSNDDLDRIFHG